MSGIKLHVDRHIACESNAVVDFQRDNSLGAGDRSRGDDPTRLVFRSFEKLQRESCQRHDEIFGKFNDIYPALFRDK